MSQYFTMAGAGERYGKYRPKVHTVVLSWMQKHLGDRTFNRAVDVACGTGDSTLPLLKISKDVIGIDTSDEMLAIAEKQGLRVKKAGYETLPEHGRFDLISTCMAFHWFDSEKAIASYKEASNPGATWLIYNFYFGGHSTSDVFNQWFFDKYLKNYPTPPRQRARALKPEDDKCIDLIASEKGWLPVDFTAESLIWYLSTQSNIEEAVRNGIALEKIQANLLDQISEMDLSGRFKYGYTYDILEYTKMRDYS